MAGPWFVRSGAGGAGTGADWANAFTTLTAANTASTAGGGETFWIADDHAETTGAGAITLTSKGTLANPNLFYCVDHTVASPGTGDLKTTATITTTGANSMTIGGGGSYYYGITFSAGSGAVTNTLTVTPTWIRFEACSLQKGGTTATTAAITLGATVSLDMINTTLSFGATGDEARPSGTVLWKNTASAILGTVPTLIFQAFGAVNMLCDGVDFSAAGAGKTIFGYSAGTAVKFVAVDCKLGASVTISQTPVQPAWLADAIRLDSGATNYTQARFGYSGTLTQETTIVRSGGASDGTTPVSWKVVATGAARWITPFECFPIAIWNDVTGSSVTATIEIVAAGALNNDDVWMEVEYLGSTLTPQASFANSTKANNLATGSALTSSTATWASSPGNAQKMSVSFTPQMKGLIYIRVYVGKASQTVYIDPRPSFNGIPVRRSYISINGVYMAEPAVSRPGLHPIEEAVAA